MAKTITIPYAGVEYKLAYTRRTVSIMEQNGFRISVLLEQPMTMIPQLFSGAFLVNHRRVKQDVIDEIYAHLTHKDELINKLVDMYNDTISTLTDEPEEDSGKVEWAADW